MTTLLFILCVLLAGYVLYVSLPEQIERYQHNDMLRSAGHSPHESLPALLKARKVPRRQTVAQRNDDGGSDAADSDADHEITFCHPISGEIARDPSSYPFARHWIRQAMVDEGLLDRIYRSDEMHDEQIREKVRLALDKFRAMKKYRV